MEHVHPRPRYLAATLATLPEEVFVLLSGPRQVGKTTLARAWLAGRPEGRYFNWDIPADRATLLDRAFPTSPLPGALVLDELHKYPRWSSWLKGLYDRRETRVPTIVTGSARLDVYQRGGDSLLGRAARGLVEQLALLLPERVASPLSVNALREDLQVGHDTVSNWLDALERLYFAFRIGPWTRRVTRSLTKERKLYLWDWSQVLDDGARFENMVASHLLKAVHTWTDQGHGDFDLHYVRDREKREVDFVVTESRRPVVLVEAKRSDASPAEALTRSQSSFGGIPAVQLVRTANVDRRVPGLPLRVVTASH